jgi:5'-nucleotidase
LWFDKIDIVMNKPLIFVTNDDGVNARGLAAIIERLRPMGRVVAVAPEVTQSGMSHAITMASPLYLRTVTKEADFELYACSGTPVDCVKMAFDHILTEGFPDIAVSGINHGSNSAISVLYSGTMGAAIEASFYGVPSVGLSLANHSLDADMSVAADYGEFIVSKVLNGKVHTPLCLNVNIPALPKSKIKGIRTCRQNEGYWKEIFLRHQDPRGNDYFWLTGDFFNTEPDSTDTDEWALANGYVSVVPIQTDMTNHRQITTIGKLLDK